MKRAHVVQIKHNEVVNYLIQHTQHKKSKYQRSNLSIQEIGRVRKRKNPRGRRKKWKQPTWPWVLNPCSAPESMAPSSAPRSVALRYRPRKRHLGWPAVLSQAPRRQDLWRRDVLPRRHESWRRPPGSKDEFKSPRGPNVNFLQKKGRNYKKLGQI